MPGVFELHGDQVGGMQFRSGPRWRAAPDPVLLPVAVLPIAGNRRSAGQFGGDLLGAGCAGRCGSAARRRCWQTSPRVTDRSATRRPRRGPATLRRCRAQARCRVAPLFQKARVLPHRRQREWARELERAAVVTRVPSGEAEVPADRLGLVPAGDRLDQGERHRHRRGDPRRRRNAAVDHDPPVGDVVDRGMPVAQLLEGIPVGCRPLAVEQSGMADDLGADADADDDGALGRLALDPLQAPRDRRRGSWRGR